MKQKYLVTLPVSIGEVTYWHGSTVELDATTAKLYSHALQAVAEGVSNANDPHK